LQEVGDFNNLGQTSEYGNTILSNKVSMGFSGEEGHPSTNSVTWQKLCCATESSNQVVV
jgi:hypothetical protein